MLGLKGELSFRQRNSVFQAKGQGKHRHRQGRAGQAGCQLHLRRTRGSSQAASVSLSVQLIDSRSGQDTSHQTMRTQGKIRTLPDIQLGYVLA